MKTFVMIPTYNEKENIEKLINIILGLGIKDLNVVVVDDDSPDGTWKIVDKMSKRDKRVHLLLRKKERGRGSAGIAGFKYALSHNADYVIEMDADFSHNPKYIPKLLKEIKDNDVILGSRLIKGGEDAGRSAVRQIITKLANLYIRIMLGIKVKDCNSGYRCFRRKVLESLNLNKFMSKGPEVVQEVLYKSHLNGFKIKEIPIVFKDRNLGKSKLGFTQLFKSCLMMLKLKILYISGRI